MRDMKVCLKLKRPCNKLKLSESSPLVQRYCYIEWCVKRQKCQRYLELLNEMRACGVRRFG